MITTPNSRKDDIESRRSGNRVTVAKGRCLKDSFGPIDRKLTYENLVTSAYRDICSGLSLTCVRQKIKEGEYGVTGVSATNADRVVRLAFKRMQADTDLECEELRSVFFGRYETLYRMCLEAKDRFTALKCLDSMVKLTGVAAPEKHQVSINDGVVINFGLPELKTAEYEEIKDGEEGLLQLEADEEAAGDMGRDS